MRTKIGLKYMTVLICLLLIGCSQNEIINSEQDIKHQNNNNEDTQTGDNETQTGDNEMQTGDNGTKTGDNGTKTGDNGTKTGDNGTQTGDNGTIEGATKNTTIENKKENNSNIEAENETEKALESVNQDNINSSDERTNQTSSITVNQEKTEDCESMETKIMIYKADRRLELWQKGELTGEYHIGLGKKSEGKKEQEGDKKTPEGEYYVCTKNQYSKFYLALGVSYPNIEDAKSGLDNGLIDETTYNSIESAILNEQCPPWNTALGGEIMIHGHGGSTDWTKGCIGVDDEVMDILWEACSMGTKIIIFP